MAKYDIADHWEDLSSGEKAHVINTTSIGQIQKWASDPDCNQKFDCAVALAKHELLNPPPELSADARHIVKHLWIIFVALPFVLAVLFMILRS